MREVVWTRGTEADLQAVYDQIESVREGAGDEFLELIDASIELLRHFPEMVPVFEQPFRKLLIRDRKHGLFYSMEDRGVILHVLADLRGNPDHLLERFRRLRE